jgi:hypothetical protein
MNRQALDQIMDLWEHDPDFRARLQADPQAAAEQTGIALGEEELDVLRQVDWGAKNLELAPRVSKVSPP